MKLVTLKKEEFKKFAENHPQASFYQTIEWGELKEENNWQMVLLGLKDNEEIKAGCLLLSKDTPIKKKMFYSPRGFLIDYQDKELLKEFTEKIKDYVKKSKGIFIKIDPYLSYQQRDLEGNIVENGVNHKQAFQNLVDLGYQHFGFNMMQETLQPRWLFTTTTKNRTIEDVMKEMDPKTRQILRKNERDKIKCREITEKELPLFKDIMQHTGDRRSFIDRPLKYYQEMFKHLAPSGILKILVAELHTKELIQELKQKLSTIEKEKQEKIKQHQEHPEKMNEKKYQKKLQELEQETKRLTTKKEKIEKLQKEKGNIIPLGGILFLIYGHEVLSLVGGSYQEFMEFQSAYTVHWEGMKYAIEHGYERYNFYGITGIFDEQNPLYGLYSFKRDFGGQVVELIGEFDLIVDKPGYLLYKMAYKGYHKVKNIKNHIKN